MKENANRDSPKTQKRSVVFPIETLEQIEKLAAKKNVFASDIIREFVDKGLAINSYEENIDTITAIIHKRLKLQSKL